MQEKETAYRYGSTALNPCQEKNKVKKGGLTMAEMTLEEKARKEHREYFRQWRARNPDKVRENNRRYWERRAAKKEQGVD